MRSPYTAITYGAWPRTRDVSYCSERFVLAGAVGLNDEQDRLVRTSWAGAECDRRRDCHQGAVIRSDQLPAAFVHHPVVPMAEQHLVFYLAAATEQPVHDVVRVAPRRRAIAAGPPAVAVAGDERPPPWALDRPLGA